MKEWSFKKAITIQTYSTYHPIPVPLNLISQFFLLTKWLCLLCARQCCERQPEKKVSKFVHDENCVTWFMFWNSKNTLKTNFPSCQIGSKVKLKKNHQSLSSTRYTTVIFDFTRGGEVDSKHVFLGAAHTWCLSTSTWVPAKLCCVHTLGTR